MYYLLGFDRFEQHRDWRCSGRVEGDEIEPLTFVVERQDDRWLLTGAGDLIVVGDASRDLVPADGGLMRRPATLGFAPYLSANLVRQIGMFSREVMSSCEVLGSQEAEHAGRPAVDLELRNGEYDISLGVDAETGIWTWMKTSGFTITVEELTIGPLVVAAAFDLLDLVPDIDLSHRESVAKSLAPALNAIQEASGLSVEVLYQDEETGEFRFILLDAEPQALVERSHAGSSPRPAVFGGVQHMWETEDWSFHVDTANPDHLWSRPIVKALERL